MVGIDLETLSKVFDSALAKYSKLKEDNTKPILVEATITDYSYTEVDSVFSSNTEFDKNSPDIVVENPTKKPCLVKQVTLSPDIECKRHGMIEVYFDDELIFKNKKSTTFLLTSRANIILGRGKILKPDAKITVFMKSDDGTAIELAIMVHFGE